MKKVTNKFKIALVFIIGLAVTTTGVYAAATLLSKDISYDNTTSGLTATNMQDAIDETYEKLKTPVGSCPVGYKLVEKSDGGYLCTVWYDGAYVSMTPTSTSYTTSSSTTGCTSSSYCTDATINPSELNLWRVIRLNDDGTVDMVSENVSSTSLVFYGAKGYKNYVGLLSTVAAQYANSKYTTSTRAMGYNGQTKNISSITTGTVTTYEGTSSTDEKKGFGDLLYIDDMMLVKNVLSTLVATNPSGTATTYCLSSRYFTYQAYFRWTTRYISTSGVAGYSNIYFNNSGTYYSNTSGCAIRPIVTLKAGLSPSSGDGTESSPFVLE